MFDRPSDQTHYEVLEVSEQASPEEIQVAYEQAKEIYASDSVASTCILAPEERRQILERLTEAYHTLIAEESRRLYDQSLAEHPSTPRTDSDNGASASLPPTPTEFIAGTSAPSPPVQAYPRLVELHPRTAAEGEPEPLERVKVTLGVKEEASGEFLKKARETAGVDLRSISQETKIGVTLLGYIEEERLDRLPVEVYLRNFVRQYARCLGLEEERVSRSYVTRIQRLLSKNGDDA